MPKQNKSSASSATRKKHARKQAVKSGAIDPKQEQQQQNQAKSSSRKGNKKEAKVKSYTPPVRPKGNPDPVDLYGHGLSPEIIVTLRKLNKKDERTLSSGIEELVNTFPDPQSLESFYQDGFLEALLSIWVHHFPRFATHHSRRIRLVTASLHSTFTQHLASRNTLVASYVSELNNLLFSAWLTLAFDIDKTVRKLGRTSWDYIIPKDLTQQGQASVDERKEHEEDEYDQEEEGEAEEEEQPAYINLSDYNATILSQLLQNIKQHSSFSEQDQNIEQDQQHGEYPDEHIRTLRICPSLEAIIYLTGRFSANDIVNDEQLSEIYNTIFASQNIWNMFLPTLDKANDSSISIIEPVPVRQSSWLFLDQVVQFQQTQELIISHLSLISKHVFQSIFEETNLTVARQMWPAVLRLFQKHPSAWNLLLDNNNIQSFVEQLLEYLELGCKDLAETSYTSLLVLLSTIPSNVLSIDQNFIERFITSYWAAFDGNAFDISQKSLLEPFARTFLDCVSLFRNRLYTDSQVDLARSFTKESISIYLDKLVFTKQQNPGLTISHAQIFAHGLIRFSQRDQEDFDVAWAPFAEKTLATFDNNNDDSGLSFLNSIAIFLKFTITLSSEDSDRLNNASKDLCQQSVQRAVNKLKTTIPSDSFLIDFVNYIIKELFHVISQLLDANVDNILLSCLPKYLLVKHLSPSTSTLVTTFITIRGVSSPFVQNLWQAIGQELTTVEQVDDLQRLSALKQISQILEDIPFDQRQQLENLNLDQFATSLLDFTLNSSPNSDAFYNSSECILTLFKNHSLFLTQDVIPDLLVRLSSYGQTAISNLRSLYNPTNINSVNVNPAIYIYINLLNRCVQIPAFLDLLLVSNISKKCIMVCFEVSYLYQALILYSKSGDIYDFEDEYHDDNKFTTLFEHAKAAWITSTSFSPQTSQDILESMMSYLHETLIDSKSIYSPSIILIAARTGSLPLSGSLSVSALVEKLLPSKSWFETNFISAPKSPRTCTLSISNPLNDFLYMNHSKTLPESSEENVLTYSRTIQLLIMLFFEDRSMIKRNVWSLVHILYLAEMASDESYLQVSSQSEISLAKYFFTSKNDLNYFEIQDVIDRAGQIFAYAVSSSQWSFNINWHKNMIKQIESSSIKNTTDDDQNSQFDKLIIHLTNTINSGSGRDVYVNRIFSRIITNIFKYSPEDELAKIAEHWFVFSQSIQKSNPHFTETIIYSIKDWLIESPRFQRFQNELASRIIGISKPQLFIQQGGIDLLKLLISTQPPLDSPATFLPTQRAVFLLQTLKTWFDKTNIEQDYDEQEDDEDHFAYQSVLLPQIFVPLIPILQSVSGSHWDFLFDILQTVIAINDWSEVEESLPSLWNCINSLKELINFASANKQLRQDISKRMKETVGLIWNNILAIPDLQQRSGPINSTLEECIAIARTVSLSSIVAQEDLHDTIVKLTNLLGDQQLFVRQCAFDELNNLIGPYTEFLSIELELEHENMTTGEEESQLNITLPSNLTSNLQKLFEPMAALEDPELSDIILAQKYLLSWLAVLKFFTNASHRVKTEFLEQLDNSKLVETSLLPTLFDIVGVTQRGHPFDVGAFEIEDFTASAMDEDSTSVVLLACHVYFQALEVIPSLIRAWWDSCKDKQLSIAVSSFTSRHFSPILISRELNQVEYSLEELNDDELTVKVSKTGREVKAVYIVDEHSMEVGVRLPKELPLAPLDVKEGQRVGVSDAQWRAWMLNFRQIMTSQNGTVVEALQIFKRNVSLHFEGIEACSICYSVICIADRSLPKLNCRVCKNRFHSDCLYKWFHSSKGRSCPLCRNNI